jgi:4-hydroxybenzoyl-CoA thioesterase/acyl-CoA thioester hydrolase
MGKTYDYRRRVEFRDTDMAGIVHFSMYFAYMEEAEHDFLRSLGFGVFATGESGTVSWPRVSAHCDFRAALKFGDSVDIAVRVLRIGSKSVTYQFEFFRGETKIADGKVTAVCCLWNPESSPPQAIEIPVPVAKALHPYLSADNDPQTCQAM